MSDITRIVLTGGISGGHTFPLVAVSRSIRKQLSGNVEFLFIGSKGNFESTAMAEEGIPTQYILTGKWRRYFSFQNLIDLFRLPIGFIQALVKLLFFMPDAVFSKGGSASVPVVLASWVYHIPVLTHDSDAVAGKANRFLARFATRIAVAYPSAHNFFPTDKTVLTGNPVREELLLGDPGRFSKEFGLELDKMVILVLGGSQGAQILNEAILRILPGLLERNIQVVHQTGEKNYETIVASVEAYGLKVGTSGYVPRAFLSATELADVLKVATIVISRAGAGSIAELSAMKKASILVPLASSANDEQRLNAYDVAEIGGALVIEEGNLGQNMFLEKIDELLAHPELRASMGEKLTAFYHPDASDTLASGVIALAQNK
ncbi:MAG: undecaprenyldiphospho-muramoylpentapeptide beta-N-acetylglucosaminyltransferase [Candidatus Moranbacteria bacterium]|nr:undecaprenyldiphospho-muramoylpentapeptide beta-N-acetylglucosaminyltransferase [Candidatus Moranbacteria bacterium]OIQ01691.1 MAG: undecaprenyldiphospho-muramoylpentapeptide beta-N-acetylglucosaminyltransferase [Candidatus Moranbacteria bacterium CG2_30_41_165]PIP25764.1 MAG: undecaprenyldiphospho-muramoylpentapeptide beta-N-acetylglucosaminyltransferase [Candidatus Moranbacteria bacterium CG23_combo_of_CG06-09_8_20_14_all_41_28]PIV86543.1 MAG: undecaprenyldiphospho-muramoylpentapeptide beta